MKRKTLRVLSIACLALVLLEVALWVGVARQNVYQYAWPALVISHVQSQDARYLPTCVAIEEKLFNSTPDRLKEKVRVALESRGVALRTGGPTHAPQSGGYLNRECTEYYVQGRPSAEEDSVWPGIAVVDIAYYAYESNGDAVLLLQAGPAWIAVAEWNVWM